MGLIFFISIGLGVFVMEFDKKKIPAWFMIATIILIIGGFNVSYFIKHISSNREAIVNYDKKDDDINPIRKAAVAGIFYPADIYQLHSDLTGYLDHVEYKSSSRPRILIVPHAGYKYSAQVAASAFKRIMPFKNKLKKIFLLGPSHYVHVNGVALTNEKSFMTPLGLINTDMNIVGQLAQNKGFVFKPKAHKKEHSLEVILPFLQKTLDSFQIIPMVYGDANPQDVAKVLQPHLERNDSLLIISADLSHYLNYGDANRMDKKTAEDIKNGSALDHHQSCGAIGINTAMLLAKQFALVPNLLDMSNSGDVSGDKDRVVGYGAWSFEKKDNEKKLEGIELEQDNLQNFARHNKDAIIDIVSKSLEKSVVENSDFSPDRKNYDNVMFNKGASFVTLEKHNKLRGCIGSILPVMSIAEDLAKNANLAATHDTRFNPITKDELKDITFKISLLTGFEEIKFSSYDDLLKQIKPKIDGLLIKDGKRQGVFLPAVWKDIPNKKDFFTELKIKAGLSPTYWSDNIKVFRFRTVEITK